MTKRRLARYRDAIDHQIRLDQIGNNMPLRSMRSQSPFIITLVCAITMCDDVTATSLNHSIAPTPISQQEQKEYDSGLDKLFDDLKAAKDADEAERISDRLYSRFRQSGSATLDLMASRAREAIAKGELPVAIEILSRIIALEPSWAEAWNLRATAFFMMRDFDLAKSDVVETLVREPRHLGALTGLALIFETQEQPREALKVYRRILDLAPELKPIKTSVERLAGQIEKPM